MALRSPDKLIMGPSLGGIPGTSLKASFSTYELGEGGNGKPDFIFEFL